MWINGSGSTNPRQFTLYGGNILFRIGTSGTGTLATSIDSSGDWDFQGNDIDNLTISGLSYPTSDGSDGQVLTTDGSGNLTFESSSGSQTVGTFTPTLKGSVSDPTVTYTSQVGDYIIMGDLVVLRFYISFTTFSGGSGLLLVGTGNAALNGDNASQAWSGACSINDISVSNSSWVICNSPIIGSSPYSISFTHSDTSGGTRGLVDISEIGTNNSIRGTVIYKAG